MSYYFKYSYYDTPEGQDITLKTFALSKYATVTGLALGTFDVLLHSHPQGLFNTTGRYLYFTGPLIGMATAFTITTNVAQNMRGKNDHLNYFLGGAMAGGVYGLWQRSFFVGVPVAVILGFLGLVKKEAIERNFTLFPRVQQGTGSFRSVKHDWSILKDLPKTYRTE